MSVSRPLECLDLTRYYREVVGLEGLELRLEAGEVFGLVGLNGAGKSTTLRLVLGLLKPSRGQALLYGEPTRRAVGVRRRLGYLPSELSLYRDRTASENLDFLARLGGFELASVRPKRMQLAERLGLGRLDLDRPVSEMSHGMRQKLGILQALEHEPDLVLMDEPSDGLDPIARQVLATLLDEVRARGGSVLLASHVLSEIETVSDRMGVLHRGRLVALETGDSLRRRWGVRLEVGFRGPLPELDELSDVEVVERGPDRLVLRAHPPLDRLVKALASRAVTTLRASEPSLEDLVQSIANGEES